MNTVSFETTYPLSPKKWWKKMIPKIIPSFFFGLMGGTVAAAFAMVAASTADAGDSTLIATGVSAFVLGGVVCGFGVLLLYGVYVRAYIRRYFYNADEQFVTIKKGVFAPREIHVQYQKIQDVYVDQDLLDRLLGLYDVHLASATAASSMEAHIDGVEVAVAEGLKNLLLNKIVGKGSVTASGSTPANEPKPLVHAAPVPNASSQTYPIAPQWMITSGFGSALTSLILAFFFGFNISSGLEGSFAGGLVIVIALTVVLTLISLGWLVLWKQSFSWSFTPDFFLIKEGVVSRKETHLPYGTIQDVILEQSVFERLFGISTVRIENAASASIQTRSSRPRGIRLPGQSLAKGQELVEMIRSVALSHRQSTGL